MSTTTAPATITRYFEAHDRHDTDTALATFTADAVVHDDGQEHVGTEQIRHWLDTAAREFTYTRTLVGAEPVDGGAAGAWVVTNHVVGDFPGGEVTLRYRFDLDGDRIAALRIAP